jgi:hypothetical protein
MKSQFAIFGLEKTPDPNQDDERSGQPYLFKKYPEHYESLHKAHEQLEIIIAGKSSFIHYKYNHYVILEIFSKEIKSA